MNNIQVYDSAFNLISDFMPEELRQLDSDSKTELEHLNDYTPVLFFVADHTRVIVSDSINGDIVRIYDSLQEFYQDIKDALN